MAQTTHSPGGCAGSGRHTAGQGPAHLGLVPRSVFLAPVAAGRAAELLLLGQLVMTQYPVSEAGGDFVLPSLLMLHCTPCSLLFSCFQKENFSVFSGGLGKI